MTKFPDLPPIWLALFLVLNWIGAAVLPWRVELPLLSVVSWGFFAVGFALIGWSAFWFWRRKTTIEPHHTPKALIVEGPFRVSRNPIYLGMAIILAGSIIAGGQGACLVLLPAFVWIIAKRFIEQEETALREVFGDEVTPYFQETRRWI